MGRLAFLLTGDLERASAVTQDVFVRSFGRYRDLRDTSGFEAYLRRSAVDRARTGAQPVDPANQEPIWGALLRLPFAERAAIVLRFHEELSDDQIARALRCGERAVRSRVRRGLARLRSAAPGRGTLEPELRRLVTERAAAVRVEPYLHDATRTRARRRRNLTAAVSLVVALASLWAFAVSVGNLRAGPPDAAPPTPSLADPFAWHGIFPQASRELALAAQRAADAGDPTAALQRSADHVAAAYATDVLGWAQGVREPVGGLVDPGVSGPVVAAVFSCDPAGVVACSSDLLRVDLTLERPFHDRPGGVWLVTAASAPVSFQPLDAGVPDTFVTVRDAALVLSSTLTGHPLRALAEVPASDTVGAIAVDPGGGWVAFDIAHADRWDVFLVPVDGSASAQLLGPGRFPAFSGDGRLAWEEGCSSGQLPSCEGLTVVDPSGGPRRAWDAGPTASVQGPLAWLGGRVLVPVRADGDQVVVSRILEPGTPSASLADAPTVVPTGDQASWVPLGAWEGRAVMLRACCGLSPAVRSLVVVDPASAQTTTVIESLPCCVPSVGTTPGAILMAGLGGTRFWIDAQGLRHGIGDRFVGNASAWVGA